MKAHLSSFVEIKTIIHQMHNTLHNFGIFIVLDDVKDDKIVGGFEVQPGTYPFVVGLWYKRSTRPFCGGSLITSNWVLTAAHCVYGKNTDRYFNYIPLKNSN